MPNKIKFSKEDIGGDILPILTTGLYRDVLDTLREYIQNAIDAHSNHIELIIDPDTITVSDDGQGMSFEEARDAIKLGISPKNPLEDVGFRGIGIYSAFNLCDMLDIYTRKGEKERCYIIEFNFKNIRRALLEDQERRKKGNPSSLYLEKLLENDVSVSIDEDNALTKAGTRCTMSGLLDHVYQRLNNWSEVVNYLQDVVPLPFNPNFKYGKEIEAKFSTEDYRVVPLTLRIANRQEPIYRPYYNEMFTYGGEHSPEFFDISGKKERFSFAWICINDARRVLKDPRLRGLLIKKFGFSISDRNYLEHYFGRAVVNRRITGEIIVKHENLIPNAARNDFEHNSTRQEFIQAIPSLIKKVTEWANRIQDEDKAKEVLDEVSKEIYQINKDLPKARRDRERLLFLNIRLYDLSERLRRHAHILKRISLDNYNEISSELKECQNFVKSVLVERKRKQKDFERQVVRSIQREAASAEKEKGKRREEIPTSLTGIIEAYGLKVSEELMDLLTYLDEVFLKERLDSKEYEEMITSMRDFMEERI